MVFNNKKQLIEHLIHPSDIVLDVGFWGQGVGPNDPHWVHGFLRSRAKDVYGVDTQYDETQLSPKDHYQKTTAEQSNFPLQFNVIFCGDVIEHLPNPGLFLEACRTMLAPEGRIIITTPNCFNMFNLFEKLSKQEPTVNRDHVAYYNSKTIHQLLGKMGYAPIETSYLYSLEMSHKESWKKKIQNGLYYVLGRLTDKFMETLVIVAKPIQSSQEFHKMVY